MSAQILVKTEIMLQISAKMVPEPVGSFPLKQKCSTFRKNESSKNATHYRELSQHFMYRTFRKLLHGKTCLRFNPISDTIKKSNSYQSISESRKL
jgi:hypothetical protein